MGKFILKFPIQSFHSVSNCTKNERIPLFLHSKVPCHLPKVKIWTNWKLGGNMYSLALANFLLKIIVLIIHILFYVLTITTHQSATFYVIQNLILFFYFQIFGPVLPIVSVDDADEALQVINARYAFLSLTN